MSEKDQVPPAPPPSFCFLDKIYSIKKQLQIFDILQAIRPTHAEHLWLVGFLKYAGYSYNEVLDIIDNHCEWSDYDSDFTAYQVATIYKQPHRNNSSSTGSKRRARKWDAADHSADRNCETGEKAAAKSPSGARRLERHKPVQILCTFKFRSVVGQPRRSLEPQTKVRILPELCQKKSPHFFASGSAFPFSLHSPPCLTICGCLSLLAHPA